MNENSIHTLEQGRAKFAYDRVKDVADLDHNQAGLSTKEANKIKSLKEKYKSGAKKLPVLIKTNGLGQALAFVQNRENFPKLYDQIARWLRSKELIGESEMIDQVIEMESGKYRQITTEILALLNWIRRFVDGRLMEDVGEDNS